MKRLILVAFLTLATLPALAQQPTPADIFEQRWGDINAASRVFDMMSRSLAESASPLVRSYRTQADELKKVHDEVQALEAQKDTLIQWLKQAQTKPGDTK